MRKKLLYLALIVSILLSSSQLTAQCLNAINEQYPDATLVPECVGAPENLVSDAYAGEYSLVQLSAGILYTFSSSIATDYLTISDEGGTTAAVFGVSPVSYTPTSDMIVRFYTHTDDQCGDESMIRSRQIQCGTVPDCDPVAIPYMQGFENGQTACITFVDVNGATELSGWEINNFFPTDFGGRSMLYSYDGDLPGDDWFFTDGLSLNGGTAYELQFKYRSGLGPDLLENLEVKYGSSATVAGMTTPLLSLVGLTTNFGDDFDTAVVEFTPATTGAYYIGFRSFSDADQGYIQLDDISVNVSLSTLNFNTNLISYFPNPVTNILLFNSTEIINAVTVYNLLGQKVVSRIGTLTEIDLSNLNAGAYIVTLSINSETKTIKIIKN